MTGFRFAAKRRGGRFLFMLVALTVAFWATTAAATVMVYFDLPKMIEESDVIVQGTVVSQKSSIDEQTNQPYTITTFKVQHAFLGKPGETLKFRQFGGPEPGGLKSRIPGDAQFEVGEECILFLVDGKAPHIGMHFLTALGQSKYKVVRDADAHVVRDFSGVAFYDNEKNVMQHRDGEVRALDSFIPELQTLIAGIKGGEQ